MSQGLFITFEGTEGAGKSTQIKLLAERLEKEGRIVLCLREPGGTRIGEEIRHTLQHSHQNEEMAPETELLLMNASRAQLVHEIIRPALNSGKIVLCDRFYDSTIAYQGFGRGLNLGEINRIINFAVGNTRPDLTVYLHIPLEISDLRRKERQLRRGPIRDRMEDQGKIFFEQVEAGFLNQSLKEPQRIKSVNAAKSVNDVQADIWDVVNPFLARKYGKFNP